MKEPEKIHHHFVPQVYLRKFAHSQKGNKNFVSVFDKIDNKLYDAEVNKICAKKYLYTLKSDDPDERQIIENFYGYFIESAYKGFYKIVTDEQKILITAKERELIIGTIVSLHLRNFFWLKSFQEAWSYFVHSADYGTKTDVYDERGNVLYPFSIMDADTIVENSKEDNKQAFIRIHLKKSIAWFKYHFKDIIFIDRIGGLVSSDKPVISLDIQDSLRLPVDQDYLVTLMPPEKGITYEINRIIRNNPFLDSDLFNLMQFDNSMRLIISNDKKLLSDLKVKYEKAINR